jgi:hypothetical protein
MVGLIQFAIVAIQIFFSWTFWQWSQDCFGDDRDALGYLWLFVSAFQFASAMSAIF